MGIGYHMIMYHRWKVVWADLDDDGECDHPRTKGKEIRIDSRLGKPGCEFDLLETIIHEAIHAGDWERDEQFVARHAKDIAKLVWAFGFRRESDGKE